MRSAEPTVRADATELAFQLARHCDCGASNEQLSCLPESNLCERLVWFEQSLVDALLAAPRPQQRRLLATMHSRPVDPALAVPALRRLLTETALAAQPPPAEDARLAHRTLVALWRFGTTARPARVELNAIIAARPTRRLVADALIGLAATERVTIPHTIPPAWRQPSDLTVVTSLTRALGDADHLVQSAAAQALDTLQQGWVDIGAAKAPLAAWHKQAAARAAAARTAGPVQVLAQLVQSDPGSDEVQFYLAGPFVAVPIRRGAKVSLLPAGPGEAHQAAVADAQTLQSGPSHFETHVLLKGVPPQIMQSYGPLRAALAIYPPSPGARSLEPESVDPAELPAGVNHDGVTAVGDIDGDGRPDLALNTCCGGLAWVYPYAEPHPQAQSVYGCMANGGVWLRDKLGWHRVHLVLPQ